MLVDCFSVVTPCFFTSSGIFGIALETRFCTRTVAMSMSVPTSKVIVMLT